MSNKYERFINRIDREKQYYNNQLQKLVNSKYGFTIKIMDSENNSTHSWTVNKESHKDIMKELKKFFNNNFYEYVGDNDE